MDEKNSSKAKTVSWPDENGVVHSLRVIECPKCHQDIDEHDYEKHFSGCRQSVEVPVERNEVDSRSLKTNIKGPSFRCEHCKKSIRSDQRTNHYQTQHPEIYGHGNNRKGNKKSSSQKDTTTNPVSNHSPEKKKEKCPYCPNMVRSDRLDKHKKKVHAEEYHNDMAGEQNLPKNSIGSNIKSTKTNSKKSRRQSGQKQTTRNSSSKSQNNLEREAFSQSFDEPRDGSKHWGHMRRENGRFGSHPIFDDYGDESEP